MHGSDFGFPRARVPRVTTAIRCCYSDNAVALFFIYYQAESQDLAICDCDLDRSQHNLSDGTLGYRPSEVANV